MAVYAFETFHQIAASAQCVLKVTTRRLWYRCGRSAFMGHPKLRRQHIQFVGVITHREGWLCDGGKKQ